MIVNIFFCKLATTFVKDAMVFSTKEKAVNKNNFTEKEWSAYLFIKTI